ncbi:hypothetical protein MPNT_520007 [Candidatus Methylacidithermus pantelleriae]|uniref:Uncharacterized protein n=1 Tax=Candidatus Methylacidithermus pantelleriae TaxID=2744239 RepID=A0A8J2BKN4_9BACT|nr:hypothetical protein MPNT_520007 [Candidatus Methylacidithermus pantelleriae]
MHQPVARFDQDDANLGISRSGAISPLPMAVHPGADLTDGPSRSTTVCQRKTRRTQANCPSQSAFSWPLDTGAWRATPSGCGDSARTMTVPVSKYSAGRSKRPSFRLRQTVF